MVICNVAKILELAVPLMEQPSETFLTTIEEDLMKLIIKYGMTVSVIYSFHKYIPGKHNKLRCDTALSALILF